MTTQPFEPALVEAMLRGAPGARERVMDLWLPVVLAWCTRMGGPRVDPEDACHDVFLVVLNRMGSIREPDRFPSWLFGITRRVLARHRRQAWVRKWVPGVLPEAPDRTVGPQARAELSETSRRVQEALEQMPEAQREVLVLCDLEERTDAEVADLLDLPLGTVKSRLRLARARFRVAAERFALECEVPAASEGGRR